MNSMGFGHMLKTYSYIDAETFHIARPANLLAKLPINALSAFIVPKMYIRQYLIALRSYIYVHPSDSDRLLRPLSSRRQFRAQAPPSTNSPEAR